MKKLVEFKYKCGVECENTTLDINHEAHEQQKRAAVIAMLSGVATAAHEWGLTDFLNRRLTGHLAAESEATDEQ